MRTGMTQAEIDHAVVQFWRDVRQLAGADSIELHFRQDGHYKNVVLECWTRIGTGELARVQRHYTIESLTAMKDLRGYARAEADIIREQFRLANEGEVTR